MKRRFKITQLDCGSCAAKIEAAVKKIDGVNDVVVNFMTQTLILDATDDKFEEVLAQTRKIAAKIEDGATLV